MSLSMYGFANVVNDACGSIGTLDEELCARWMHMGVMMPMLRNNFAQMYVDQETQHVVTIDSSALTNF